ncbi:hypothetical protein GPALN_003406 [Globodera pallida]|nr:hypothetical protein GPALN_003406 [Globodera pallida]
MLRIKNENKNGEIIIPLKVKIKQLIGPFLMTVLEFLRPIELQIEAIIGEYANASEYALFLSDDRQESAKAEIRLSIRIYFGEIWENISKFKCFQIEQRKIEHLWNRGDFMKVIKEIVKIEKKSLETIFEFYHNITGTNDQKREKCFNKNNKSKTKKQISNNNNNNDILEVVRKELLGIHTKFMITLNMEENAFSNLLRNSLIEEKGAKAKLRDFYSGKDFVGIEASKELIWANVLVNMEKEFPELKKMLRDGNKPPSL